MHNIARCGRCPNILCHISSSYSRQVIFCNFGAAPSACNSWWLSLNFWQKHNRLHLAQKNGKVLLVRMSFNFFCLRYLDMKAFILTWGGVWVKCDDNKSDNQSFS